MKDNRILLIGIGILYYLVIITYAFNFHDLIRILLLNIANVPPLLIKLLIEIIYITTGVLGTLLFFKLLKHNHLKSQKIFISLFILYILGQLIQFVYPIYLYRIDSVIFRNNLSSYYDLLQSNLLYSSMNVIRSIILDIILVILFYRNRNLILSMDLKHDDISEIGKMN